MIKINEFFYSIQGESTWAGFPTVFVRTSGCHLRCHYCDTKYAYYQGQVLSLDQIYQNIESYSCSRVCITGGEPLLQKEVLPLMRSLCDKGYQVSLETSGAKSIELVDPRVKIILDVKTPDSGEGESFEMANLNFLNALTEFKFVISSKYDLDWSIDFCRRHALFEKYSILFSPSWGVVDARWLAEHILAQKLSVRLQLQQHKYIWSAEQRGV